ncbi:MAG TPA: S-layer protein, partial [Planctomycetaceae bacterium]|nr:S-layer protein [Planctomycetaceae bacterium]
KADSSGEISVLGPGRGAVVAWFASRIAVVSIDVPYPSKPTDVARTPGSSVSPATSHPNSYFASVESKEFLPENFADEIVQDEWQALGLAPSPGCDDATFLRRAHLDTTGILPSADHVLQFLQDDDPQRRSKLIDHLLASQEYVDYWSYQWSDLLLVNGNLLRPQAVEAFYRWIHSQVQQNTPWDQFARSIVLAKGDSIQQGATNFYAIHQTPEAQSENTCLAFMGLSIECAKCHNHPLERWTNDQYYAMANLFSRVRAKGWGGDPRNGDGVRTLVVLESGDLIQPSRGKPQPPAPLDQAPLDIDSTQDRRKALADWLTGQDNP